MLRRLKVNTNFVRVNKNHELQNFRAGSQTGYIWNVWPNLLLDLLPNPTLISVLNLPSFRAAARPLTTAIGCLRQNSCSCGLNASFLFSKYTEGVGGRSCSLVSRCCGGSGGCGGGALSDRMLQLGTPFNPWPLKELKYVDTYACSYQCCPKFLNY